MSTERGEIQVEYVRVKCPYSDCGMYVGSYTGGHLLTPAEVRDMPPKQACTSCKRLFHTPSPLWMQKKLTKEEKAEQGVRRRGLIDDLMTRHRAHGYD